MKSETPLTEMYLLHINGALEKTEFEGKIFKYLLCNFDRFKAFFGDRDHWNEFLSWLYPRFARAIDLYKDLGSSFDAYIAGLVHSAAREFRHRETDHIMTEYICWQARAAEMKLAEYEPEYQFDDTEEQKEFSIPDDINPKQILMLLLKSYYFVSDDFIDRVARAIGMEKNSVFGMIEKLRNKRSEKEKAILDMRERLHCQHYRCLSYQTRMNASLSGTDYFFKMKGRFERARRRYFTMKKRLEGMRLSASNRMIAEVLGIPRGTVDSCLFAIKNRRPHF